MPRNQPEESRTPAKSVHAIFQNSRIPHFRSKKAARWFVTLERYFAMAKITNDAAKVSYIHANLAGK
jgi:hypothetical protein